MSEVREGGARDAILEAAFRRFARYGYRRTSLGDIADEAGLSRPALYHYFRNKEDVFGALSLRINQGVVEAVTEAAGVKGDLEARLGAVLAARVGWQFNLLHASEHGRELIDEKNRICAAAGVDANARFAQLIADILARADGRGEIALSRVELSPEEAARFLVDSVEGVVGKETSEPAARRRLQVLTRLFVGGLRP